jgi:hypothetical protein
MAMELFDPKKRKPCLFETDGLKFEILEFKGSGTTSAGESAFDH